MFFTSDLDFRFDTSLQRIWYKEYRKSFANVATYVLQDVKYLFDDYFIDGKVQFDLYGHKVLIYKNDDDDK